MEQMRMFETQIDGSKQMPVSAHHTAHRHHAISRSGLGDISARSRRAHRSSPPRAALLDGRPALARWGWGEACAGFQVLARTLSLSRESLRTSDAMASSVDCLRTGAGPSDRSDDRRPGRAAERASIICALALSESSPDTWTATARAQSGY